MPYVILDGCETATGWTVLGNDTDNLAASTTRVQGDYSLEFDKVDGDANKKYAGAYKTLTIDHDVEPIKPTDQIMWWLYVSATTDVNYAFLRLGTDASNYGEFRYADSSITAEAWTRCSAEVWEYYPTGTTIDWSNLDYLVLGVMFDAAGDTLEDIKVDAVMLHKTLLTVT